MNKLLLIAVSVPLMASCGSSSDTEKITVASAYVDCVGVAPQKCLLIKRAGEQNWRYWHSGIEGFDYEPGYEYVIRVRKENIENPAMDQSSIRYILVKVVSKKKKESEHLPQTYPREIDLTI